jgi:hypothetical protein
MKTRRPLMLDFLAIQDPINVSAMEEAEDLAHFNSITGGATSNYCKAMTDSSVSCRCKPCVNGLNIQLKNFQLLEKR